MKCPRCVQSIHRSAVQCPHCGFAISELIAQYGAEEVRMRRLNDAAGVLRLKERQRVEKWMDQFEVNFPQLFFSVYYCTLDKRTNIRQFGMWLLNHAAYEDVDIGRPNDGGIMLVVDLNTKVVSLSYGYLLDFFITEEESFNILAKAHPHLLQGNHMKAMGLIIKRISQLLKKRARKARRKPEYYKRLAGVREQGGAEALPRIRSKQKSKENKEGEAVGSVVAGDSENKR